MAITKDPVEYKACAVLFFKKAFLTFPSATPKNNSLVFLFGHIIAVTGKFCSNLLQITFLSPQLSPKLYTKIIQSV